MPIDSPKSQEAADKLPQELQAVYRQMVEQYEFVTFLKYGRGYVAYEVLAEMILAGWRPSGDMHPSSSMSDEKGGTLGKRSPRQRSDTAAEGTGRQ